MRNLEVILVQRSKENYSGVSHIAIDENIFTLKSSQLQLHNSEHVFDETYECITNFEILTIEKVLWFGTGTKFIWVNFAKQLHEINVECEFTAAVWNPTQDAISIVFTNGNIGVFIVNLNDNTISCIGQSHLIDSKPCIVLNVGWGTEETQFRGTAGKLKVPKQVTPVNFDDDLRPRISWRGNGEMFAVNYSNNGQRKFKVFKYPCELLYESTSIIGLQPIIAWKPEGNIIAGVIHTTDSCKISFFEKNGFIKNQLELDKEVHVIELKWSMCGQILCIYQSLGEEKFLDMYTTKNYVWYLKQRLTFTKLNPLIAFQFKENFSSIVLLQVTTVLETIEYSFKFVVHTSPLYNDLVICASINANSVLLTNCKKGMIPPPAYDEKIMVENPINFIQFHPEEPKLAIIDCRCYVKIYSVTMPSLLIQTFQGLNDTAYEIPLSYHHFIWISYSQLLCLKESIDSTFKFVINTNSNKCLFWQNNTETSMTTKITYLGSVYADHAYLQQSAGSLTLVSEDRTQFLSKIPIVVNLSTVRLQNNLFTLSLTTSQEFYIDEVRVLTGVLSFIIHQNYLLLSTTESTLLSINLDKLKKSETINIVAAASRRTIEQGGYLLCGIPNSSMVILQMPRGNIETCTIRVISIDRIEYLLERQAWSDALDLVRLERLNPTILIDLNFNRFIDNVDKFVDSVRTPAIINDFLLGLQEENVFSTVFKDYIPVSASNRNVDSKVEKVCTYLINYLESSNYTYYIQCIIIACFIKNSKSNNEALGHIRNLLNSIKDNPTAIKIAESAFKGINTLKPQCDMYQNALAMYDLDLALFIARNLQMDPKEYEPFVNRLKELNEIKRRFEINNFLKNYENAVKYLVRFSENNEEIIEYVKQHDVFSVAYNYTKRGSELHKQVGINFAEHLRKQKLFEEAAFVFYTVECYQEAFENYKQVFNITHAILMLREMKLSQEDYNKQLQYLSQVCIAANKILEAGRIYETYLSDYHQAMDLYITHNYLPEAQNCAIKFNCLDEYKHSLFEGALLYCEELHSKLKTMKGTFGKYTNRLSLIKSGKLQKLMAFGNHHLPTSINDDTMSIADSLSTITVNTSSSRASTASRRKRKEERKKQDLREGGVYEDIALMRALYELIVEVFSLGPIVRQLCLTAVDINTNGAISYLSALHNALLEFQLIIKKSLTEIWPLHLNDNELDSQESLIYENVKLLEIKYREPPSNLDTNWKVNIMSCS